MDYRPVPMLEEPIAAGSPVIATDQIVGFFALRTSWIRERSTGNLMFMRVNEGDFGDSMINTILPGALLTVDVGHKEVQQGDIYVVRLKGEDGGVTVKRLYVAEGNLICSSDNKAYTPIVVSLKDESIHDLVVGKVLRWTSGEE